MFKAILDILKRIFTGSEPPRDPVPVLMNRGKIRLEIDLRSFKANPQLDYYAAATFYHFFEDRVCGLEISVRGLNEKLCVKGPRCLGDSLGIVARMTSHMIHDGQEPDEHKHQGEGINYHLRLPIGDKPVFEVTIELLDGFLRVLTPKGAWLAMKGYEGLALSDWTPDAPDANKEKRWPRRAWARDPWFLSKHGGRVRLLEWTKAPEQGSFRTVLVG